MLTVDERERYGRQILIDEIGPAGQETLKAASVLIVGAGGLGSSAALYLAAAGVGALTFIDHDRVELSNLNRQILYGDADIGALKVDSAGTTIRRLNPSVAVDACSVTLTADNAPRLLAGCDVAVDALDNAKTRFILNKAAMDCGIPLIHGAVNGLEGRVLTVLPGKSTCLRCMHNKPVPDGSVFPVIGVTPAVIGALQATEVIKVLLGIGDLLTNRLLVYDGLRLRWTTFKLAMNPRCDHCGSLQERIEP